MTAAARQSANGIISPVPSPQETALAYTAERYTLTMTTTRLSRAVAKATPLPKGST